jgi:chemotaxis protein methyltransferase CheR
MTPDEFGYLRDLLKERSGLVVTEEKQYLLETRLMPLARKSGVHNMSELIAALRAPDGEPLRKQATEAMTINESFFFRDKMPFENFENIMVPTLTGARGARRQLRIWSAAASTGQEPYSLAIQVREMEDWLAGWNVEILGTDISAEVLEKARSGLYSQFEVQRGMPIQKLVQYFQQNGSLWQIDSALRAMVRYEQFNLLDDFSRFGTFDIVFCRNVLIYFDADTKRDILARIARQMAPDGYLVLGAAETVLGIAEDFTPVPEARGLYALNGQGAPAKPNGAGSLAQGAPAAPADASAPATAVAPAAAPASAGG